MANDLDKCFSKTNLFRAWRWLSTNPSYLYKNYFRDIYTAYALSVEENIEDLASRLRSNTYFPCQPSIVFLPKKEFITRPFTLLTIEDQIVYQAFVNIIAEKHLKVAGKSYNEITFGNLYAGKSSIFFYRKWDIHYKKYNKAMKNAYKQGYNYIASFDLTACFDSIDHKVLRLFLERYSFDKEFIDKLVEILSFWSTNSDFYKSHGIPQGPMSSGLLSEIILYNFDKDYLKRKKSMDIKYFRYVDDIRLMSKDIHVLKLMLARLDYICKHMGLFPQASKIEIHKIKDIDDEIKNISDISYEIKMHKKLSEDEIEKQLFLMLKNNKVNNPTKFKMYLSNAKHSARLSNKLIDVLSNNQQFSEQVGMYFKKYPRKISNVVSDRILEEIGKPEIYQFVNAQLINAIKYKLSDEKQEKLKQYIIERWKARNTKKLNPFFRSVVISYLFEHRLLTYSEMKNVLKNEADWWVLKTIQKYISPDFLGEPSFCELSGILLKDKSVDISVSAAYEVIKNNCNVQIQLKDINHIAQRTLKFAGIINKTAKRPSIISERLSFICKKEIPIFKWGNVFGTDHKQAESMIVRAYSYVQNDMSALVNILDSFNDLLLSKLFLHDTSLGGYTLGKPGAVLSNENTKLERNYPKLFAYCKELHDKRLSCDLSHPITKKTNEFTKPVEYRYIYKVRSLMSDGYLEFVQKW